MRLTNARIIIIIIIIIYSPTFIQVLIITSCAGSRAICPAPLRTVRPSSSPYTPYARGSQLALLPVSVGATNIHDYATDRQTDRQTDDRQTDVRRQAASLFNDPPMGRGITIRTKLR